MRGWKFNALISALRRAADYAETVEFRDHFTNLGGIQDSTESRAFYGAMNELSSTLRGIAHDLERAEEP
jgi:hypothetical protein